MVRPSAYDLRVHVISRFNRVCNVKEGVEASQLTIVLCSNYQQAKDRLVTFASNLESCGVDSTVKISQLSVNFVFRGKEKTVVFKSKEHIESLYGYERNSSIFICDTYL